MIVLTVGIMRLSDAVLTPHPSYFRAFEEYAEWESATLLKATCLVPRPRIEAGEKSTVLMGALGLLSQMPWKGWCRCGGKLRGSIAVLSSTIATNYKRLLCS